METRKVSLTGNQEKITECGFSIETKQLGTITVRPDQIITVPQGLPGFSDYHRYILVEHGQESPFLWFQCVDNPALAFVVIDPRRIFPDYPIARINAMLRELEAESAEDLQVFVIVTIPRRRPQEMTANLLGPLLINPKNRQAKQLILDNPWLSHQYRLIPR
ncbi:MAG: flagellar assembly protein FliW [Desulfobacteraceae bacterium]